LQQQFADIRKDQERLRANLKEMPATAAAYKRYLLKFDNQETAIEKLQQQIQELETQVQKQHRACEVYLESLDVESTIRKESPLRPPPASPSGPLQPPRPSPPVQVYPASDIGAPPPPR
jgi:hypothetical protein